MSGVHYGLLAMSIKWENRIPKVSKPRFSTEDDMSNVETCLKYNFTFCSAVSVPG